MKKLFTLCIILPLTGCATNNSNQGNTQQAAPAVPTTPK